MATSERIAGLQPGATDALWFIRLGRAFNPAAMRRQVGLVSAFEEREHEGKPPWKTHEVPDGWSHHKNNHTTGIHLRLRHSCVADLNLNRARLCQSRLNMYT
jgi:hypothetical protein